MINKFEYAKTRGANKIQTRVDERGGLIREAPRSISPDVPGVKYTKEYQEVWNRFFNPASLPRYGYQDGVDPGDGEANSASASDPEGQYNWLDHYGDEK